MSKTSRTAAALLAVPLTLAPLTLALAPAASAAPATDVYTGCTEHSAKPAHISLSCADDSVNFHGLSWSAWASGRASGVGTFNYNTCLPTCVDGNTVTVRNVRVTLSKPKVSDGVRYFSLLTAQYPNGSGPAGMSSSTFVLNGPPAGQ